MWTPASPSAPLQYLLSDKEVKIKTALWMAENSTYLKEQKGTLRMQHHLSVSVVKLMLIVFIGWFVPESTSYF